MPRSLEDQLTREEQALLKSLTTPMKIQDFLDSIPYRAEDENPSPLRVIRERRAHCLDGGLFGAMALRRLGYPPLVIDLLPVPGRDDDHVLAIYREHGCLGAVAKSNHVGLRFREPVYRTYRELVMSYFEVYFNVLKEKTLRAYTVPMDLSKFDRLGWEVNDSAVDAIEKKMKTLRAFPIITPAMAAGLNLVDERSYAGHTLGTDMAGVYKIGGEA